MKDLIPSNIIERKIFLLRGESVMLDSDLALLYRVETKQLKRAVNRNIDRFPDDFMLRITEEEYESLRCHFGTLERGKHSKYLPYAFTEQGVAMLSSVLNNKCAIKVNIQIMRAFTKLRKMLIDNTEFRKKIDAMEKKYDQNFKVVFEAIKHLITTEERQIKQIGFKR